MKPYYYIIICLNLFLLNSCYSKKEDSLLQMMQQPVSLPLFKMIKISPTNRHLLYGANDDTTFKLIHYIDSASCSICELKVIYQWDNFIYKNEVTSSLEYYFIVDARKYNKEQLTDALSETYFSQDVYLDSLGVFLKHNTNIPSNRLYHTFLLDKNNNVVLVGNPLNNTYIEELLY